MLSASVARWEVTKLLLQKKSAVRVQQLNTALLLALLLIFADRTAAVLQCAVKV